ncbi:zinc finger CCCH domain-containing protein 27 isoform X1 [Elaeis guineensis]|uniref:Zinc finger CCCH domain-containing protein 27 n=2 Tax=Elaeis guineensis var. tenera TaxID=51953 RepID=A0A6I9RN20_ELAGV|nr:zinc finger CCCH domain-containing protein 27 [Elaeis guineensis]
MALAKAKEIASSAPVVVFSKTYCECCKQVKQLLTQLGATYKVIELDVESDGTALQSALTEWTGQRTVPNVFIGGKHLGVCDGTKSFITKLFQALEDGSISIANANLDVIKKFELSLSPTIDTVQMTGSSPKEEIHSSSSSEPDSDTEDKEISDDDDRNHKHRRREVRPHSFDNDVHAPPIRRPNRKRNKPFENGQQFLETDFPSRSEKRRAGLTPQTRALPDSGPRARANQFRSDSGSRFDSSASVGRPSIGRGRGRNTVSWSQHDSRFNQYDTLDFASQMGSQGPPTHSSLYVGTGLPSAASTQNTSWGAYGFIPGMNNRILDTLHPLGLQGTLQPPISPLLNIGMPRQRCRDFEERGFCLRGDMCPMEHGVNRIVVEDVQSLSQFNLPVSIPTSHALGIQAGAGSLPPVSASSSLLTSSKAASTKNNKSGVTDDALKLNNGVSSASGVAEADVYDPDQPLWNNEHPETSSAHLRLPTPNNDDDALWEADSSAHQGLRLIDGIESEHTGRTFAANSGSVWGRIGPGNKAETGRKANSNTNATVHIGNEMKIDHEDAIADSRAATQGTRAAVKEMGPKATAIQPLPRLRADSGRNGGRASQKASRTLYVNGIPQKSNRREALLSHFQKFGEVIDIYIPLNSEKAFVQFSKREEAEAALKAPDAVMGNRFIKLWWANRDTISDEGDGSVHNKSMQSPGVAVPSVAPQLCIGGRGKENLPSTAPKGISVLGAETSLHAGGPPKNVSANGPKAAPPVQKKVEGLELLKEELRKKQEILDKKRDEFRRRLDKLEKQAISSKKGEVAFEQAGKMYKMDMTHEADRKAATSTPTNISTAGVHQEAEKTLEKRNSGEILVLSPSKENSTTLQQSPRNIKQTCCLPAPVLDRFKLDNSPTSFRVVPPLPVEFANVAALKDHFSSFGDLSSVVLEEPEAHSENAGLNPSHNCSACVTFTTRHSAMRAFLTGKCWQGHSLQFVWLTASPNSSTDRNIQETSTPLRALGADVQADVATSADVQADVAPSGSSSLTAGKSTCNAMSEVAAIGNGVSVMDTESTNFPPVNIPKALAQTSDSNTIPCEEHPPTPDVSMVEDNINIGFAK